MFGRGERIRCGAVASDPGQGGQVTQRTCDVWIPVQIRNKCAGLNSLVANGGRDLMLTHWPPLPSHLPVTHPCGPNLVAVEEVVRIHRIAVIPVLIMNTKPQLEKLVSQNFVTTRAILRKELHGNLDDLAWKSTSSWNSCVVSLHDMSEADLSAQCMAWPPRAPGRAPPPGPRPRASPPPPPSSTQPDTRTRTSDGELELYSEIA